MIDLTDLRAALAGRILGDLGADVILVEPPGGAPERLRPPFVGGVAAPDRSLPFLYRNANKRGMVIALAGPEGRRRLLDLCDRADILVENLGPEGERRYGLSPEEIAARHPHLIHVAISDFGLSGPLAAWRLEPLPAFAASGALYASGFRSKPPCWLPGYAAHDCAASVAVAGALAGVLDRARHGRGQTIEVSVQEAGLAALDPWGVMLADYAREYPVLPTSYPRDGDGPYLVLPTADGYVRVVAATPRQWAAFAALLVNGSTAVESKAEETGGHLPDRRASGFVASGLSFLSDQGFRAAKMAIGLLARLPLPGAVLPVVSASLGLVRLVAAEALRGRPQKEVLGQARRLGLPIAPVNTPEEFVAEEQTRARGYFRRSGFPGLGDAPFAPFPCNLSRTPATLRRPAPSPGEDDPHGFGPRIVGEECAEPAAYPLLAGMRVVSLGVGAVVPELCRLLAELGAEVIKIEAGSSLDFLRRATVEPDTPNRSWTFNDENRGQQSVCLDLSTPRGHELALRLCAAAEVVAENHRGGVVGRFGLDYEAVRMLRPDVIYVSSQGFGRGGPLGEAPAFGPLNAAFAGITYLWNYAEAPYPGGSSLEHPDHLAGQLAAAAVLAALEHRRRTGEGQFIELAQTEAAAYLLGEFYLEEACAGRAAAPSGNAVEYACPHGVYPSAGYDRWCAIAVVGDEAWERFRGSLGWAADFRLSTLEGRLARRQALDARVAAWTRKLAAEEAAARLQAAGVSAMAVQGPEDHRADPHLAARGALVTLEDPEIGPVRYVANPLRMGRSPLITAGPAPRLGADTEAVLTRVLGFTAPEVARFVAEGVCR